MHEHEDERDLRKQGVLSARELAGVWFFAVPAVLYTVVGARRLGDPSADLVRRSGHRLPFEVFWTVFLVAAIWFTFTLLRHYWRRHLLKRRRGGHTSGW